MSDISIRSVTSKNKIGKLGASQIISISVTCRNMIPNDLHKSYQIYRGNSNGRTLSEVAGEGMSIDLIETPNCNMIYTQNQSFHDKVNICIPLYKNQKTTHRGNLPFQLINSLLFSSLSHLSRFSV